MAMFGNNKPDLSSKNGQSANQTNQFVEGTTIEGDVKSSNDIRVDGSILGTLQSNAKIVIGAKGVVEGDIHCANADISGTIRGRIEVKDLLLLKSTANIEGDIVTNKLVVEAGARFNGTCSMGAQPLNNGERKGIPATEETTA